MNTATIHLCEEEGCDWEGTPCFLPDNPIYGLDCPEGGPPVEAEPDHYYCARHAYRAGFCHGCGSFWGGVESFDFNNPSHVCENCRSEIEDEDEEMEATYSTYPFDGEGDWKHENEEEDDDPLFDYAELQPDVGPFPSFYTHDRLPWE